MGISSAEWPSRVVPFVGRGQRLPIPFHFRPIQTNVGEQGSSGSKGGCECSVTWHCAYRLR